MVSVTTQAYPDLPVFPVRLRLFSMIPKASISNAWVQNGLETIPIDITWSYTTQISNSIGECWSAEPELLDK